MSSAEWSLNFIWNIDEHINNTINFIILLTNCLLLLYSIWFIVRTPKKQIYIQSAFVLFLLYSLQGIVYYFTNISTHRYAVLGFVAEISHLALLNAQLYSLEAGSDSVGLWFVGIPVAVFLLVIVEEIKTLHAVFIADFFHVISLAYIGASDGKKTVGFLALNHIIFCMSFYNKHSLPLLHFSFIIFENLAVNCLRHWNTKIEQARNELPVNYISCTKDNFPKSKCT